MSVGPFVEKLLERLHSTASVKTIYGDPMRVEGKTIIPVARVAYGLGRGYGRPVRREVESEIRPESGGGGVLVYPVGVVEVTPAQTRYVPISGGRGSVGWLGLLLATAVARRLPKRLRKSRT